MNESTIEARLNDNGGRRSGVDRRQFSYTDHIPERRAGEDRRSGFDRRSGLEPTDNLESIPKRERRRYADQREAFKA